ncbi:hypothetical protein [Aliiroseovarius crassostreae]|uniref:hypothetical protein n=1 Tax=Aliiroseovarius crassostreae TaxID=154981 RepID=UPI002200AFC3|nr:hypothetical protein [Aliiroseovarius crassostreae]UWP88377.1 hypothetical protein K3J57_10750 [Aliiroseovarius crassostreae]
MTSDVTRFPRTTWDRIRNRRGRKAVNCIVSGRYLAIHGVDNCIVDGGHPVSLNVMTDTDPDQKDRNMCEMIVTLEELERVVSILREELAENQAD